MKLFKTYWKAKKIFKFPKIRFYVGVWKFGLPMYLPSKWINICYTDVGWKDKYGSPRFEYPAQLNIVFFKRYNIMLWLQNPIKNERVDEDYAYWEQLLWMIYYCNNDLNIARSTWPWKDMSGKSTWKNIFIKHGY